MSNEPCIELHPGIPWASCSELNRLLRQQGLCLAVAEAAILDQICQAIALPPEEEQRLAELYLNNQGVDGEPERQAWLQRNIARCSVEQLSAIKGNSPSWLGHALTPELAGLIEGAVEVKAFGNSALLGQLYESLGKEGTASVVTYKNPTPRAPVVQPPMVQGGLAGAVNYGNVVGPSTAIVNQTGNQNTAQNTQQFQSGWNSPPSAWPGQMPNR